MWEGLWLLVGGSGRAVATALVSRDGYLWCCEEELEADVAALAAAGEAAWHHPFGQERAGSEIDGVRAEIDRVRALPALEDAALQRGPELLQRLLENLDPADLLSGLLTGMGSMSERHLLYQHPVGDIATVDAPLEDLEPTLELIHRLETADWDTLPMWDALLMRLTPAPEVVHNLVRSHWDPRVRVLLVETEEDLDALDEAEVEALSLSWQEAVARRPRVEPEKLRVLISQQHIGPRVVLASRRDLPREHLVRLAHDPDPPVRRAVASNPSLSSEELKELALDTDLATSRAAFANPSMTVQCLLHVLDASPESLAVDLARGSLLSLPALATSQAVRYRAFRAALAERADTPTDYLIRLSEDADASVRLAVAETFLERADAPVGVLTRLLNDPDWKVQQSALVHAALPESLISAFLRENPAAIRSARKRPDISETEIVNAMIALLEQSDNIFEMADLIADPLMPPTAVARFLEPEAHPDLTAAALRHPACPVPDLLDRVNDPDHFIRLAALEAMDLRNIRAPGKLLATALNSPMQLKARPGVAILEVPSRLVHELASRLLADANEPRIHSAPLEHPENPWQTLTASDEEFVAPIDELPVHEHNARARPEHRFRLDMVPEPFLGNVGAPVIVLTGNPRYREDDLETHHREDVRKLLLANLRQQTLEFPLVWLDPLLHNTTGAQWYLTKLRALLEATSLQTVATNLAIFESLPYHSEKLGKPRNSLPSQLYTNHLARQAIIGARLVIWQRGPWSQLLGMDLSQAAIRPRSKQTSYLTPNNLGSDVFRKAVQELSRS